MNQKPVHSGHRQRIRQKYLASEFQDFNQHEILELLLFYGIPRKDTNETAHRLINEFGSLSAVMDAPVEKLRKFGLPENAAIFLHMLPQLGEMYLNDKNYNFKKIYTVGELKKKIMINLLQNNQNTVLLYLFDTIGTELFSGPIKTGYIDNSDELISKIVGIAMKYNAVTAVIAHNNYSGILYPSPTVINMTEKLKSALQAVSIRLTNHYIVSDDNIFSMAESEEFCNIFKRQFSEGVK